jgi:addiction module RelE/StbE family toxin
MRRQRTRVVWSAQAVADLREIAAYIREYSPRSARRIRQEIKNATRRLELFPLSGRFMPELPDGPYREVIVRDYRILYESTEAHVEILTVVHGTRDLPALLSP